MFAGKKKAVTFSYDDGVTQDKRLIEILNKYSLKCTFNINSAHLGTSNSLFIDGVTVAHCKPKPEEIKTIYSGHEIAGHTLTHPLLTKLSEEEIINQVEQDRLRLSEYAGYEVVGFAYPCGGKNYDSRVSEIIRNNTGAKYCRTIESNASFEPQKNLYEFKPSVYHMDFEKLFDLGRRFLELETDTPKILYIWGHSYEFDVHNTWAQFEEFCKMISGKSDIFYGTNKEVLLS
ncbi:MAG: polysaccharide deacetylase family protein [Clostridiales bacterium]|nr:polysaccharide deacetylase family protein [Clostridiales bacterium]